MEVSEFTLKLIILLIPGAICSILVERLTTHKKWSSFTFVANSILYGGLCYLFARLLFPKNVGLQSFWNNLTQKEIPFEAVLLACLLCLPISVISARIDTYRIINKLGRKLKVTFKFGDISLYYHFLNDQKITEVFFRDFKNQLTYFGLIESYNEIEGVRELTLRAVKVYNFDSTLLYELDKLYLCRAKEDFTIEVPIVKV